MGNKQTFSQTCKDPVKVGDQFLCPPNNLCSGLGEPKYQGGRWKCVSRKNPCPVGYNYVSKTFTLSDGKPVNIMMCEKKSNNQPPPPPPPPRMCKCPCDTPGAI